MRTLTSILTTLVLTATAPVALPQGGSDPDSQVLVQLRKAGSNISKPHEIEFFLYFKTKDSATRASGLVAKEGCRVAVEPGADHTSWLCDGRKRMVPRLSALVRLRKRFEGIARKYGGEYDGWETAVVK